MATTVRTLRGTGALALGLLLVASASAQQAQPARPGLPRAAQPGAQQQQPKSLQPVQRVTANKPTDGAMTNDQMIANCLLTENQAEIAIAQFAQDKLDNKDVRKFAEMLVKEHAPLTEELERFGAKPVQFGQNRNRERERNATEQRTSADGTARAQQPMHMSEIHREIAERCVNTAEKELGAKDNAKERDECFVGMQIGAHYHMIDSQKVLREYASPELRALLDKSMQSAESHLDQAKHLMRELAHNDRGSDKSEKSDK